jgi:hypothetical protein
MAALLVGTALFSTAALAQEYPGGPPPPAQFEAGPPPPAPGPNYALVPGYWQWAGGRYVWVGRHWQIREVGFTRWTPGHWAIGRFGRWHFVPGHWVR